MPGWQSVPCSSLRRFGCTGTSLTRHLGRYGQYMQLTELAEYALQFFEEHGQVCPAGWNKGDEGMVNTPEGVASYLGANAEKL